MVGTDGSERRWELATTALVLTVVVFNEVWLPGRAVASSVAILLLFVPRIERQALPWLIIATALAFAYVGKWETTDNHEVLIIAVCGLAALVAGQSERAVLFATGARSLVASVFGLAVLAKLVSPDFRSGTFGEVWPAIDLELVDMAERVGAIDANARFVNAEALDSLQTQDAATFVPVEPWFANGFTLWTLVIEVAVLVGFAVRRSHRVAIVGDVALLAFLLTTYAIVPVLAFAAILATLGLAQARHAPVAALYVGALAVVPLQEGIARFV